MLKKDGLIQTSRVTVYQQYPANKLARTELMSIFEHLKATSQNTKNSALAN